MKAVNLDTKKSFGEVSRQSVEKYLVMNNFSNFLSTLVFVIALASIILIASFIVLWLTTILLSAVLFIILLVITIGTLGIAYIGTDLYKAWGWFDVLFNNTTAATNFIAKLYAFMPYFDLGALAVCIGAIVLLAKSQNEKKVSKIVWLSISIVVLLFCAIMGFAYRGGAS